MSKQMRAKVGREGLSTGEALIQQLYGLSQTPERTVFESDIRNSLKDWAVMNPRFVLALACLTNDIKLKVSDQYQWPEHLELAGLYWRPHVLITCNLSEASQKYWELDMLTNLICKTQKIEVIGPQTQSHHILLSFDHTEENSLELLMQRWKIEIYPVKPAEIIDSLIQRPQLDA